MLLFKLLPKLPNSKIPSINLDVMEEDNCSRREFGQPGLKIMAYRLVGVQPVNVEPVSGALPKPNLKSHFVTSSLQSPH